MYILGISSFAHESSCALIKDGEIRVILEEERLNREKHTCRYPRLAIEQCLRQEGITIHDVDKITFFWIPFKEIMDNAAHFFRYFPRSLNLLRTPSVGGEWGFLRKNMAMRAIGEEIKKQFDLPAAPLIEFVEHHLCHAASAFDISPFKEAAILTVDGRGESATTMMAVGRERKIEKIKEIQIPHSLGHLYAAVTSYLGFRPFFDEWKVMGMSAYGKDNYKEQMEDVLQLLPEGDFQLNLKYFYFHTHGQARWLSSAFEKIFGPCRQPNSPYEQRHYDIALALQKRVEEAGVHLACNLYERTKLKNLCMAGGVVLNCLMNKRIVEQTPFERFFFQPIANDAGTSLGSALYYYHQILDEKREYVLSSVYHGNEFFNEQIEAVLKEENVRFVKSENIARDTARHIAENEIVGWFQGRMEAGPRALGNRSITVSPLDPSMKDKLNARIKKREFFRPFAPSVLEEKVAEYFLMPKGQLSPYMILVGDVRDDKKSVIPAVTHADGTARVHTVSKEVNPRFWQLIKEFEKITGVPVLLNTSFNENEPIVCHPRDAVRCFLRTEFDVLAIGDFLVVK